VWRACRSRACPGGLWSAGIGGLWSAGFGGLWSAGFGGLSWAGFGGLSSAGQSAPADLPLLRHGAGEGAPPGAGQGRLAGQHLDAHMVGAGLVVPGDPAGDGRLVTPGDQCVHEPVARLADVVVGESQPEQIRDVVRRLQVDMQGGTGDLAGGCRVGPMAARLAVGEPR